MHYGDHIEIEKNVIKDNRYGIWFYYTKTSDIKENDILNNARAGIYLETTFEITINYNLIRNNMGWGIGIGSGARITIDSNLIRDNSEQGLLILRTWFNQIKENNFISNGKKSVGHTSSHNCRNLYSTNYYNPISIWNLDKFCRIFIHWGLRHSALVPDLYFPMISGIDFRRARKQNPIPYPDL